MRQLDFQPIKQVKISNLIIDQIKSHITKGNLQPGDPLPSERELMKIFNVSRASLREALKMLDAMGYVEIAQRKRTRVKSLVPKSFMEPIFVLLKDDMKTVQEIIEVRKCMETWNAYYAAKRATEEDLDRLRENIESMIQNVEKKSNLVTSDAEFHLIISTMTHNNIQSHLMFSIYDTIRNTVGICYEKDEATKILQEHRDVLLGIEARDPEKARLAMAKHLDNVQTRVNVFFDKKNL
jgi:GntR family transcriptional repressor for pyruvate dehydrogenase complex